MFATIFIALYVGHLAGDYFIQTDHQAQHKGLTGDDSSEGRWNCLKHAFSHTMTMLATLMITFTTLDVIYGSTTGFVIYVTLITDGITHYVIDRRWTLRWFAELIGKKAWIDNDTQALPVMDQAAHTIIIFIGSLVIASLM